MIFRNTTRAFTLIEVMVAMVILAIVSAIGYRSLSFLIDSADHLHQHSERLLTLDRSFSQVEADFKTEMIHPTLIADGTPHPKKDNTQDKGWSFAPVRAWIPSPDIAPELPPALEPYLTRTYTVSYEPRSTGGVERQLGCADERSATMPYLCQRWFGLNHLPTTIEFNPATGSQKMSLRWVVQTSQGSVERLWVR